MIKQAWIIQNKTQHSPWSPTSWMQYLDWCTIFPKNSTITIYLLSKLCLQKISWITNNSTPAKLPWKIWWFFWEYQRKLLHAKSLIFTAVAANRNMLHQNQSFYNVLVALNYTINSLVIAHTTKFLVKTICTMYVHTNKIICFSLHLSCIQQWRINFVAPVTSTIRGTYSNIPLLILRHA